MAEKQSLFGKLANTFGFMRVLGTHERVNDKYNDDLVKSGIRNQKELIAPPTPDKEQTTAFGEYFHSKGAVKVVSNVSSMSNYFKMDIDDHDHKNAIDRYRSIALMPEVDDALDEYIHSIIVHNENDDVVRIDFKDSTLFTTDLKDRINDEFKYILKVLDFDSNAEYITRHFLVDGCFPVEKVFDENYIKRGIIDVNFLDPTWMTKVDEFDADPYTQLRTQTGSYYVFSFPQLYPTTTFNNTLVSPYSVGRMYMNYKLQIPEFLVAMVDTGKYHPIRQYPVSILHRALKVANQLRLLEDSILIYRLTRAPERRIFYIDVGNLPPAKAEEHIEDIMRQYRTEKIYNTDTGSLNSNSDVMSMLEDFWLPRRNGTATTEVSTLSGAQNLGEISDLDYFYKKLWRALGVPYNRRLGRESSEGGNHPHTTEIAADEIAFYKHVRYLRKRIEIGLFKDLLKTQLITREIINADFADDIMENIKFVWNEDNNFSELIKFEVMSERFDMVTKAGYELTEFLSKPWVAKNLLNLTDGEIEEIKDQRDHPEKYGFGEPVVEEEGEEGESEPMMSMGIPERPSDFSVNRSERFTPSSSDYSSEPEINVEVEEEPNPDFEFLP
jgi:hypothetical protein